MTFSIRAVFYIIAALCATVIAHSLLSWLFSRRPSRVRALADFAFSPPGDDSADAPVGSQIHKIRLAFAGFGLDVSRQERFAFTLTIILFSLGLVIAAAAFSLPPLFWLGGPAIAYFTVSSLVNSCWNTVRTGMEKEIPIYLMNLSSVIQLNPNVTQALADASLALDPRGGLKAWIRRLTRKIQAHGRQGLDEMQAEAGHISPSLLLIAVEIRRLWETGGSGFSQSFQMVSENLAGILESRSKAFAKASGAWGTIRVIILALGGAIFLAFSSPGSSAFFHTPISQIAIAAAVAWAIFGISYIGDLIRESVE